MKHRVDSIAWDRL